MIADAVKKTEETTGIQIENKYKDSILFSTLHGLDLDNERKTNENWTPTSIRRAKQSGSIGGLGERALDWLGNRIGSLVPLKFY